MHLLDKLFPPDNRTRQSLMFLNRRRLSRPFLQFRNKQPPHLLVTHARKDFLHLCRRGISRNGNGFAPGFFNSRDHLRQDKQTEKQNNSQSLHISLQHNAPIRKRVRIVEYV